MFEPGNHEQALIDEGIYIGEAATQERWLAMVSELLAPSTLDVPSTADAQFGGRKGYHTDHLQPMLDEMTEVYRLDPSAEW
jgi:ring-1,2-phenylacetyl-CoA epoxidase subunit PaaC